MKKLLLLFSMVCLFAACTQGPSEEELKQQQIEQEKAKIEAKKKVAWESYMGTWYIDPVWKEYVDFDYIEISKDDICIKGMNFYYINLSDDVLLANEIEDFYTSDFRNSITFGCNYNHTCDLDTPCNCLAIKLGSYCMTFEKEENSKSIRIYFSWIKKPFVSTNTWPGIDFYDTPILTETENDKKDESEKQEDSSDESVEELDFSLVGNWCYTINYTADTTLTIQSDGSFIFVNELINRRIYGDYEIFGNKITFYFETDGLEIEDEFKISGDSYEITLSLVESSASYSGSTPDISTTMSAMLNTFYSIATTTEVTLIKE